LADAQQPAHVPQIAILSDETPAVAAKSFESFTQGLRDLAYIEDQNITFARRYADGKMEVLLSLAAELVGLQPDVIFAIGTPAARAAKASTETIPIIFARISDPKRRGLGKFIRSPAR
jgi:putative ABC transport system substrate-binding protein